MGNIDGTKNQDSRSWSEEKGLYSLTDSGGRGNAGYQGENAGYQSQRVDRTDCEKSNFFPGRTAATGGMLSQLINDYRDQVAAKKLDLERIENEIDRLETSINQFEVLLENLEDDEHDEENL